MPGKKEKQKKKKINTAAKAGHLVAKMMKLTYEEPMSSPAIGVRQQHVELLMPGSQNRFMRLRKMTKHSYTNIDEKYGGGISGH